MVEGEGKEERKDVSFGRSRQEEEGAEVMRVYRKRMKRNWCKR